MQRASNYQCCDASQGCIVTKENPVPGEGPVPADVMFVGEAPTSSAQTQGRPFPDDIGSAGHYLQSWFNYLGLNRDEIYVTNVIKCPKRRGVKAPTFDAQANACWRWLDAEILRVKPKLVVALGETAQKRFCGQLPGSHDSVYGRIWDRYPSAGSRKVRSGITFYSCLHPSWLNGPLGRNPVKDEVILRYLDEIRQILDSL